MEVFYGSLAFLVIGVLLFGQLNWPSFPKMSSTGPTLTFGYPTLPTSTPPTRLHRMWNSIVREEAEKYCREHASKDGKLNQILHYITTFVGGGGPRFWFSVRPSCNSLNYSQVLIELKDKEATPEFISNCRRC